MKTFDKADYTKRVQALLDELKDYATNNYLRMIGERMQQVLTTIRKGL